MRYFDGFKRSLFIVAKSHECNEVLDPTFTPGSDPERQDLFEAKQTFMFHVFNANLQTDMGKTIVRRHLDTTDAKSDWRELSPSCDPEVILSSEGSEDVETSP